MKVVLCECFARDGLQHEAAFVATEAKIEAIDAFIAAGFPRVEATSYAHPGQVPAFADSGAVLAGIARSADLRLKATCPNLRAVERALADRQAGRGAGEISLLVSASESHSQRNLRRSRADQWQAVEAMARLGATDADLRLVGVVSVAFGCPFEGRVDEGRVVDDVARFVELGARHVTIGDTTGMASPMSVRRMFARFAADVPRAIPIAHFHDSRGLALTNCVAALEAGCIWFDSAMGGTGGHPAGIAYGEGETGNVATEDLVNLLEEMGADTGLDLDAVVRASRLCERILGRTLQARVARAGWGLSARARVHG